MKVLIVDDESLVRIGMKNIIPWEQYGYQVVGEAANGLEALVLSKACKPDIILVDIVMPEMNGLDFIREIRDFLPGSKFIILSCKDDVDFYRNAIKLGVFEYIQKGSIEPGEILKAVDRAAAAIKKERVFDDDDSEETQYVNRNLVLTEFFNKLLKGQIKDEKAAEEKLRCYGFSTGFQHTFVLTLSMDLPEEPDTRYDGSQDYSVIQLCQEILRDAGEGYVFRNFNDRITAVVFLQGDVPMEENIREICYRIQETVRQFFLFRVTVGVSSCVDRIARITEAYGQALTALERKYLRGSGMVFFYDRPVSGGSELAHIAREKERILEIRTALDGEAFSRSIGNIAEILSKSREITPAEARGIFMDIMYHIIGLLRKEGADVREIMGPGFNPLEYIERPGSIYELKDQMIGFLHCIRTHYFRNNPSRQSKTICAMQTYIEEHIFEKFSLDDIAGAVHLSTVYTSRFYKKETGENLQHYIVRMKIEKSKEMLMAGKSSSEIAERIGFSSESHFYKVFKVCTGLTPRQYMRQLSSGI